MGHVVFFCVPIGIGVLLVIFKYSVPAYLTIPPFEKGGQGGFALAVSQNKSPSIPLFQRGRLYAATLRQQRGRLWRSITHPFCLSLHAISVLAPLLFPATLASYQNAVPSTLVALTMHRARYHALDVQVQNAGRRRFRLLVWVSQHKNPRCRGLAVFGDKTARREFVWPLNAPTAVVPHRSCRFEVAARRA